MSRLETAFYDLGRLELLAEKNTRIHRLDPRVKVLTTLLFIIYVVSFNKYEIARLLPFFLFPALLIGLAELPFGYLLRKIILVSPFVLCIGIFNPFLAFTFYSDRWIRPTSYRHYGFSCNLHGPGNTGGP
jgi:cobalt/nickel transport system permease protein